MGIQSTKIWNAKMLPRTKVNWRLTIVLAIDRRRHLTIVLAIDRRGHLTIVLAIDRRGHVTLQIAMSK